MKNKTRSIVRFNLKFYAAALLIALLNTTGFGGSDIKLPNEPVRFSGWDVVGPNGGDVRVVTVDPKNKDRIYISTLDGQIHVSNDGGGSWKLLVNFNRPQLVLDQMIVDSRDSKVIYASGHRFKAAGGFFKTKDGGLTWKEAKELRNESIHAMEQSSKNPELILVGTLNGVWKSEDAGDNWQRIESETNPINVNSLAIDPVDTNIIYAGTWWRAYKTTDGGKNWRLIKDGMIDDSDVFAIEVDRKNPDHVIASACSGIYQSFNKGEKWNKIQGIPSQSRRTRDIKINPGVNSTFYAATTEGFWMSSNSGRSWAMTTQRDLEINSISVHPENPSRVFIGTNNYGVMVSNDGGRNFSQVNENFSSRLTYTIVADIEQPDRLYATTHNTATGGGFVFISEDGGTTWRQPKNFDAIRISPFGLIQDREKTNILYLATNVGMFKSQDRGLSWTQIVAPKPKPATKAPVRRGTAAKTAAAKTAAPKAAATTTAAPNSVPVLTDKVKLLTYTEDGKNGIFAGTDSGLYRSYDVEKGWEKISFGEGMDSNVFVVHTTPLQPETIWVGTARSGVIVSRDNGKTWNQISGIPQDVVVSSIASDPNDPQKVYVGTFHTFYLSRDGGKSWTQRGGNLPLGKYTSILINPNNTDEIFISSALESDGGIYYSSNAGMNWHRIDSKDMRLPSHRVWAMIFDPHNPNRIFAGTHSSGVYRIDRAPVAASNEAPSRPRITTTGN